MLKKQLVPFVRTFSSRLLPSVKALVDEKAYSEIPDLLYNSHHSSSNPNPFSFLSIASYSHRIRIVDEILQSWIYVRPQSRIRTAYSLLLSYTLQYRNCLPLALAVLQQFLRSGSVPHQQFYLTLSWGWVGGVRECGSPCHVFEEMKAIGYFPDCNVCNFVISSLCAVDRIGEALEILKGMREAGCLPDVTSYGIIIAAMCDAGRISASVDMIHEMVQKESLMPRQDTVWKVVSSLRVRKELRKAAKVIELLEKHGCVIQFTVYESLVKACVDRHDYVMAARLVVRMANRSFVPHINTRQSVIDGLVAAGKSDLASSLRLRLADMNS